ncbi:MAG: helix-turn-helix transcriptional regulator [Pseudomonadota bacterium]
MIGKSLIRVILVLQILAALLFLANFFGDVSGIYNLTVTWRMHELIELGSIVSMVIGSCAALILLIRTMDRNTVVEEQLKIASGDFYQMLDEKFAEWDLTAAEREVALLSLKGFSVAEVAEMRGKSLGTIKAQNASLYRKAEVTGRAQLMASLMEDLLDHAVTEETSTDDRPIQQTI